MDGMTANEIVVKGLLIFFALYFTHRIEKSQHKAREKKLKEYFKTRAELWIHCLRTEKNPDILRQNLALLLNDLKMGGLSAEEVGTTDQEIAQFSEMQKN